MTEDLLRESLFGERPVAEVVIGYYEDKPVAFAVFFHNFSTFLGKPGLYLEDLFVIPEMRGKGFGRSMLVYLAKLACERGSLASSRSGEARIKTAFAYQMYAWQVQRLPLPSFWGHDPIGKTPPTTIYPV